MNPRRLLPLLLCLPALLRAEPLRLDHSTITEVVNVVEHIAVPTQTVTPAATRTELRAPDRLRTGRDSRAELQAEDGTITRLGAGTLFAFDPQGRELRLERGSLLFHSPTGRGGGTIRSTSASATVLGTTLIAAATADGGYKLLVLEGHARVDFATGARLDLTAGQMTFVRPGLNGTGAPGPVLQFDLARQIQSSKLVHGFARPLPSLARIEGAVKEQAQAVNQGRFTTTGFLVFAATSDTQVSGIETAGPDADDKLKGEFTAPQRLALNTSAHLTGSTLPATRLFRTPLLVPAGESAFLNKESDILLTGLLADTLTIATPTLDLSTWNGPPEFNLVAKTALNVTGSLQFTGLGNVNYLRLFSPVITVPANSGMGAAFAGAGTFYLDTDSTLKLDNFTLTVSGGGFILQPHAGDLVITGGHYAAESTIGAPLVVPGAVNLDAPLGAVSITGATIKATGGTVASQGLTLTLRQTAFILGGNLWLDAAGPVTLDTLTFTTAPHAIFQATTNDVLTARALDFNAFAEVNMGARTLVLENVHFAAGTTIRLVSANGLLAPLPNTGQNALGGYVNFIRDVTYAGQPAQDYVPVSAGGTGNATPAIQISKPGGPTP